MKALMIVASLALALSASGQKSADNPPGVLLQGGGQVGTLRVILTGPDGQPAGHVGVMVVLECPDACLITQSSMMTNAVGELRFDPISVGKYLVCSSPDVDSPSPFCFLDPAVGSASCTVEITPEDPKVELYMQIPRRGMTSHGQALCRQIASQTTVAQSDTRTEGMYDRTAKAQAYEAQGFQPLDCFGGQVKIHGKRLSQQSFSVFRPDGDMKCCGEKIGVGRTDTHGHFLLEPLSEGEYFTVFDGKATQYTVSFAVVQTYQRCDGAHVELNFSTANKYLLQTYADVDYDEKDCSEDDAACYRK